jgi:hypothetical protein
MVIVSLLSWWYTIGWKQAAERIIMRLAGVFDFFSIDLLITSLFAPFRQISAGRVEGPLPVILSAFVDKLISRIIGAYMRTMVMLIGIVSLVFMCVWGVAYLLLWAVMPVLPIIGLTLMLSGWIPWQL